jgi:predicted RNA-binding Zn-ribbon protein involved in translation (DUF1610 family)
MLQGGQKPVLPALYIFPAIIRSLFSGLRTHIKFMGGEFVMTEADAHEITFQCPNCGHELKQTIGRLKANEHMTCSSCGIGINIDASRLAKATEEIQKAIEKIPPEISIKFFR